MFLSVEYYYYSLFTQNSLVSTYCTVINEGPAIEDYIQSSHLSYGSHSAQSDNPERIAVREDPMRVRTHIVRKIQPLSS